MYQVVYISTARREYGKRELADILEVSRRNNTRDDITGVLCYHGGTFFQMLEGDEERVRAVMARVDRDPRHYGVTILLARFILPAIGWTFEPAATSHLVGIASPVVTSYFAHKYFTFAKARGAIADDREEETT